MIDPLTCMIAAIFFEARSEPVTGQYAVAEVIMNRVESQHYPDDVCSVVFQRKQFSFTHDGLSDNVKKYNTYYDVQAANLATDIAIDVLTGFRYTQTIATHYHTTAVNPYWSDLFEQTETIGTHIFYAEVR